MKSPAINQYLDDMKRATDYLLVKTNEAELADLETNYDLQLIIERLFEILGEAATRIPPEVRELYPTIPWRKIIDLRNVIVHCYEDIDVAQLFVITKNNLETLRAELELILIDKT